MPEHGVQALLEAAGASRMRHGHKMSAAPAHLSSSKSQPPPLESQTVCRAPAVGLSSWGTLLWREGKIRASLGVQVVSRTGQGRVEA